MKQLKTNYVPGDPVTSAGQNEVNAAINEIAGKVELNALNTDPKGERYHAVFKVHDNDPLKPDTLEIAAFTVVSFNEITQDAYNALTNKYTDPLPNGYDVSHIYREEDFAEDLLKIPYTKDDGKGDDKAIPGTIVHKWGDGNKGTVYAGYGLISGGKYYQIVLNDAAPRIQIEADGDVDIKSGANLNVKAKTNILIEGKTIELDGPTQISFGELTDGQISQFKATGSGNAKGCDKLVVELYNNSKDNNDNPIPATINIAEANFLKGTPIKYWYVLANAANDGDYDATTNPTGKWLEPEGTDKKETVAAKYGLAKAEVEKGIHHFDMSTDTFYNEGIFNLLPKEKVKVASCHIFDVIKFVAWAKNTGFGPWEE